MTLGDILTLRKGNTIKIQDAETYRISGIQNCGKGVVVRREVRGSELTMRQYQVIEPNQLMWCKVDTKNGAFGVTHPEHAGTLASPNMALADINLEKADPNFIETLFRVPSFADYITNLSSGTTNRKYLTPPELLRLVSLPDWDTKQQTAFVHKLRQIEDCGLAKELTHQETLLEQLQQAILQEAIAGKLTADWRAAHPQAEPARQLLHRIQAEKARLIAAKKLRPEKPLPPITSAEIPFAIPKTWEWCRLGEIAIDVSYGTSQRAHLEAEGIPVLRMGNITRDGQLSYENLKYVSPKIKDLPRLFLESGDIVFNRTNSYELVGKSAVFRHEEPFTLASYLIRVRLFEKLVPEFITHFINSAICREEFIEPDVIQQNGQANFNGTKLKTIPIPLPPLAEQAAIVARVETLLGSSRLLAAELAQSRTHAAHLLQAVLKSAFTPAGK